jgi:hypothetical protein
MRLAFAILLCLATALVLVGSLAGIAVLMIGAGIGKLWR